MTDSHLPCLDRHRSSATDGFTLVELLVVMLIVAILSAIAIPTLMRQRVEGYRTQVRSDLVNTALAVESAAVDVHGDYSAIAGLSTTYAVAPATLAGTVSGVDVIEVKASTPSDFCLRGSSPQLGAEVWYYSHSQGTASSTVPAGC
mgnify:CR=1 FL=1